MRKNILLEVDNLNLYYGPFQALKDVSFKVKKGTILGIVGESGSGKSTVTSAILKLLPTVANVKSGKILFDGSDMAVLNDRRMRDIRGAKISYVSQDPMRALTPTLTIGQQMTDIQFRNNIGLVAKKEKAIEMLEHVGMPEPHRRMNMFPHELSGGQLQRVSIAMAVMMQPELLIADEPTTALDATLEVQIIDLLKKLQKEIGCTMIFVTHHLGVVSSLCDDVVVMHNGYVRECGNVVDVFNNPQHEYTKKLLRCDPALIEEKTRLLPTMSDSLDDKIVINTGPENRIAAKAKPVLAVDSLRVTFSKNKLLRKLLGNSWGYYVQAVKGVGFDVKQGETVALVGESGSGKTTLARSIMGLQTVDDGSIRYLGTELTGLSEMQFRTYRKDIMMMFQDPVGSLSPRMKVGPLIAEPMKIHNLNYVDHMERVQELLEMVGLGPEFMARYPHELSGGQARRVGVARALALSPKLIIADEPTAGLDVSVQGEVLNLLARIQDKTGVSILIITHNLNVVRHLSDRVLIMYMGEFVETGPTDQIFANPKHEYTQQLIAANHHPAPSHNY